MYRAFADISQGSVGYSRAPAGFACVRAYHEVMSTRTTTLIAVALSTIGAKLTSLLPRETPSGGSMAATATRKRESGEELDTHLDATPADAAAALEATQEPQRAFDDDGSWAVQLMSQQARSHRQSS